jgi:hypothetical protein
MNPIRANDNIDLDAAVATECVQSLVADRSNGYLERTMNFLSAGDARR